MTSYQEFMPGKRANMRRVIQEVGQRLAAGSTDLQCLCLQDKFDKSTVPGSYSPSVRATQAQRVSYLATHGFGGRVQYGNYYHGEPMNLNYLGRQEGMPGGSGAPLRNRFN